MLDGLLDVVALVFSPRLSFAVVVVCLLLCVCRVSVIMYVLVLYFIIVFCFVDVGLCVSVCVCFLFSWCFFLCLFCVMMYLPPLSTRVSYSSLIRSVRSLERTPMASCAACLRSQ